MARVTVVIATYNWSTVLPYSIASVLDQTFADFELLVIGDGCTDDSGEVVAAIADTRVRWHNLATNTGHQSGPNNEGIRRASGDLIAYLGHDDLWLPWHLEVLVETIDGGARIAHGTTLDIPPDERPTALPPRGWTYEPTKWIPPTAVVHDRAIVEAVGGWRHPRDTGTIESEAELWARMADVCGPPVWVGRLTNLKLPASRRSGVYRDRPSHEQAHWLRRIREADELERDLLADCAPLGQGDVKTPPAGPHTSTLVRSVRTKLQPRSRLRRLRRPPAEPVPETAEERRLRGRRFKGVDDGRVRPSDES